jgi:hypothetical protein
MKVHELQDILSFVSSAEEREKIFDYVTVQLDPLRTYDRDRLTLVFKGEQGHIGVRLIWHGPEGQMERFLLQLLRNNAIKKTSRLTALKFSTGKQYSLRFKRRRGGHFCIAKSPA